MAISFASHRKIDEERVIHSKSNNIEIMINDQADEVIAELFQSFFPVVKLGWKH